MKKNKGFTLIELLAILVILAIIALIITPIISGVIKDSRIKGAENATRGLIRAVEVYYGRQIIQDDGVFNNNQTMTIRFDGKEGGVSGTDVDGDSVIEYSGYEVTGGSLTVDRYGTIKIKKSDELVINGYFCNNNDNKVKCSESSTYVPTPANLLPDKVVTTGSGLYKSQYEEDRYVYRGTGVNNYIRFNNELWRIISLEANGTLKIVRNASVTSMAFNSKNYYNRSVDTYCSSTSYGGCNAWSSDENTEFVKNPRQKVVTKDSEVNVYLNETYYNKIGEDKKYIIDADWGVQLVPSSSSVDIGTAFSKQKEWIWRGKIALISIADFMYASTNSGCSNAYKAAPYITVSYPNGEFQRTCSNSNWLYLSSNFYFLNPATGSWDTNASVWYVNYNYGDSSGGNWNSTSKRNIFPSVYLTSDIVLSGSGTRDKPYYIVE